MKITVTLLLTTLFSISGYSQMTTRVVADNLFIPWEMVWAPDSTIWFTQKNGYICKVNPSTGKVDTIYHEPQVSIRSEGGMLGMVLHPDFTNTPHVFVAYNYSQGGYKERVVRYTYDGSTLQNATTLLDDIAGANFHNGCRMVIVNNQLYITTGDATNTSTSQNLNSINGKLLRINLDGSIPNDNPIPGSPVWSWGHRNAQGLTYANGRFYSSEHGPANDDEVNIVEKGRNYGWPNVEGYCNTPSEMSFCNDSNVVEPIMAWTPTIAVSGIAYYNHPMFPSLQNSLIMATLKNRNLWVLKLNSTFDNITTTDTLTQVHGDRLRAVCVSPEGRLYISTSNSNASGTAAKVDKIIEIYDPNYNSIIKKSSSNNIIDIFPNPAKDVLKVTSQIDQVNYSILSVEGKQMKQGILYDGMNNIDISSLSTGVYTLNIEEVAGDKYSHKFQKL